MNTKSLMVLILSLFVATTACMDGTSDVGTSNAAGTAGSGCTGSCNRMCDPGEVDACTCTNNGTIGQHVCNETGSGFGACVLCGCSTNADCASGKVCELGKCMTPPGSGGSSGTGGTGGAGECVPGESKACDACPAGFVGGKMCGSDKMWGSCTCVVPNGSGGTGGTNATGGTGGSSAGTGGSSAGTGGSSYDWVWVEFVYTLPAGAPEIRMARAFGWVPGYPNLDSDFCNSNNIAPANVFVRSGNTFRCSVLLPPNWREGEYNVEVNSVNGAVAFPSKKEEQHFCGELMGNDIPSGGVAPYYIPYGALTIGAADMNSSTCRKWNGQTGGGCNIFPNQCG